MTVCQSNLVKVEKKIKAVLGADAAAISFTKDKVFDSEEPYRYHYKVEIFPENIQLPNN